MSRQQVDYDLIASQYDQRFQHDTSTGIFRALRSLIDTNGADRILEVGCGTGHWLALLSDTAETLYGMDVSRRMLLQAQQRNTSVRLAQGRAENLPYQNTAFDLIYCVNAIHHFEQPERFVQESAWLLRPGGILAMIGSDPHHPDHQWYVYDYFKGTRQTDLDRFPSQERIQSWMKTYGFENLQKRLAQFIQTENHGYEVLRDPFLSKEATSQLTLLSDDEYQAGLARIKSDLEKAADQGEELIFRADIQIFVTWGRLPGG